MKNKNSNVCNFDGSAYKSERSFTYVDGLKVNSFSKISADDEKKELRRQISGEIVRILRAAGRL